LSIVQLNLTLQGTFNSPVCLHATVSRTRDVEVHTPIENDDGNYTKTNAQSWPIEQNGGQIKEILKIHM
jgi:hypothetical protein